MPVCIDTPFFLLRITVPLLRIHNSCLYLYLSSVLLLGLRVYATKWSHETNAKPRKVLDYHYLSACSFFLGLAELKSNGFITIGYMMKRNWHRMSHRLQVRYLKKQITFIMWAFKLAIEAQRIRLASLGGMSLRSKTFLATPPKFLSMSHYFSHCWEDQRLPVIAWWNFPRLPKWSHVRIVIWTCSYFVRWRSGALFSAYWWIMVRKMKL